MTSLRHEDLRLDDQWIIAQRGPRNRVDPSLPYAITVEPELGAAGDVADVATVFLTNRECPFHCLMCDLWKNTTTQRVPDGAIPAQLEYALPRVPSARRIKLYNSGNFFDGQAIPRSDWAGIAQLLAGFQTVIVESHPRLIDTRCKELADLLEPDLEVAMGLETVDPAALPHLNKRMTLADYENATKFLNDIGVRVRAFILLRAPFQSEAEGVEWARRSIEFAFSIGVECCSVIPTRVGNGAMEWLQKNGHFSPPSLASLEETLDYGVSLGAGRVFADLWDIEQFFSCADCGPDRVERMRRINLSQEVLPRVTCHCGS
jgi:radical SAM enzyme (TIGR01210 family)